MAQNALRLTAAQVIILAAEDITSAGATEFTEWDLTVAAWGSRPEPVRIEGVRPEAPRSQARDDGDHGPKAPESVGPRVHGKDSAEHLPADAARPGSGHSAQEQRPVPIDR